MTNPDDLAYPSYQEGYAPQRGLTKREVVMLELMKAITLHPDFKDRCWETIAESAEEGADAYFEQLNSTPE